MKTTAGDHEKRQRRKGKLLYLMPLIAGAYGALLGLGLTAAGLAGLGESLGLVRFLMGMAMIVLGLYGILDGVQELVRWERRKAFVPIRQFIFTDVSGNRSYGFTIERIKEQLKSLTENGDCTGFHLQILPPIPFQEQGKLERISCIYRDGLVLMAFFVKEQGGCWMCRKCAGPDMAAEWFERFLSGVMDFCGWEEIEKTDGWKGSADAEAKEVNVFAQEFLEQGGEEPEIGHQLLAVFREGKHDERRLFSARDLELAVEGMHDGENQRVILEWGTDAFDISPGVKNELMVVWYTYIREKALSRIFAREGTANQVKFWLIQYLREGTYKEMKGWNDITTQVEKEWRKQLKLF